MEDKVGYYLVGLFFLLGGVFWNYSLLAVCIFVR